MDKDKLIKLMKLVIEEVDIAIEEGNSPFAAILFDLNTLEVVFKNHNTAKSESDVTRHAEINLISEACRKLKTRDLSSYGLISNAWSCSMCMSAAIKAKISNFVFGAPSEENMNPLVTVFDIQKKCKNKINIMSGILENECRKQIIDARSRNNVTNYKYNVN